MDGSQLPDVIESLAQQRLSDYLERAPESCATWLRDSIVRGSILRDSMDAGPETGESAINDVPVIFGTSQFIANYCITQPLKCQALIASGDLDIEYNKSDFQHRLDHYLTEPVSEKQLMVALREFRNRELVRIIWRDFTRKATMEQTTCDMTWLAEVILETTLQRLHQQLTEVWGQPFNNQGQPQFLVILGMGKLGAWELNVSSDIDLIFAYPDGGETEGGRRKCSNQEFFIKLGQNLVRVLDENTAAGFVFRVDMRLRPYGESGPLVMSFDAMEQYYQTQGRDWERYAMLKARVVAGDVQAGLSLMAMLRPFTYRKYLDFSVIESLRQMKILISREVQRLGNTGDIKKGAGGIREIEFIVQAFQIIHGGRDRRLQITPLKQVLPLLEELEMLPNGIAGQLYQAYTFLRNLEHVLQGWNDQQTQRLPTDALGKTRIAFLMGFEDWEGFTKVLEHHRTKVTEVFSDIIAVEAPQLDNQARPLNSGIWLEKDATQACNILTLLGYKDSADSFEIINQLRESRVVVSMPETSRQRLEKFMPFLIAACGDVENDKETLKRAITLVQAVLRRSAYLVMLTENPHALNMLVKLCSASPWIAQQLARYPVLLDELLDSRSLFLLPDKTALVDELRQQLLRIPEDDLEAQMEVLRYFKISHSLKIAACEVTNLLPLMKVSDNLTWLAEALLEHVLDIAWRQVTARYGEPGCKPGQSIPEIAIIGYGKLGGIEMGHSSDLDLVFLHNAESNLSTTTDLSTTTNLSTTGNHISNVGLTDSGKRPVDNATFFTRLGQRIIHLLTAQTPSGTVYEVDMRLRPSGNSGLLVSSLHSFEQYQNEKAWTWEHQALVRARPVAGSVEIGRQFQQIRSRILAKKREPEQLQQDIVTMREKMRTHLGSSPTKDGESSQFNIKQDVGGIVDIEFIVQYFVLRYAYQSPELIRFTDNMRILDVLENSGLLSTDAVQCLKEAYVYLRSQGHQLNLQGQTNTITRADEGKCRDEASKVTRVWQSIFPG